MLPSLYTLVVLNLWAFGSGMIIFLAGLRQIPTDLPVLGFFVAFQRLLTQGIVSTGFRWSSGPLADSL